MSDRCGFIQLFLMKPDSGRKHSITSLFRMCSVCVCVCVHVFVTNQDIDLYNDTGMTQVLQGEGDFSGH